MATQIQIRRDTSTNWTSNNPTLSLGEVAYETDTRKLKVGDGVTAWTTLPYFNGVIGGAGLTATEAGDTTLNVGAGTGITVNADDIAVDMTAFSTTDLSEGTNLYYTDARVDTRLGTKSTTDIAEGTNLYHTDARARAAISVSGDLSYNSTTGVISYTDPAGTTVINDLTDVVITTPLNGQVLSYNGANWVNGAASAAPVDSVNSQTGVVVLTTTDIAEGTNLYYTQARFDSALTAKSTTDLSEGTNLYYTDARFDTRLGLKSTTDVAEGTNLYFTAARVDAEIADYQGSINTPGTVTAATVNASNTVLTKFNETVVDSGSGGGAVSFDVSFGSIHKLTLTSDVTSLALTNAADGATVTIFLTQDGVGSRLLTAGISWKWASGNSTLSTDPNAVDIISVIWDGTTYWASLTTGYA